MRSLLILYCVLISYSSAFSQNVEFLLRDYKHTIYNEQEKKVFNTLYQRVNPVLKPDRFYFWYSGNVIHTTQGAFSGKLLNGAYDVFYLNKGLKEQGFFNEGLKHGQWLSWYENGTLKDNYKYKNGLLDGRFEIYNTQGELQKKGKYNKGKLIGPVYIYHGDTVQTKYYRKGVLLPAKPKSLLDRFKHIFH